jgi:arylsulfatase A-like enzyme
MKLIFSFLIAVCLQSTLFAAPTPEGTAERPNVLLILTDDQGYGDLSLYGNPYLKTPNLDRLGTEGVRFDRFYVNSVCAPSRASILTGRYAVRTGVYSVTQNGETIKPSEVTIAKALQNAGYRTACFGKWHNGPQAQACCHLGHVRKH